MDVVPQKFTFFLCPFLDPLFFRVLIGIDEPISKRPHFFVDIARFALLYISTAVAKTSIRTFAAYV